MARGARAWRFSATEPTMRDQERWAVWAGELSFAALWIGLCQRPKRRARAILSRGISAGVSKAGASVQPDSAQADQALWRDGAKLPSRRPMALVQTRSHTWKGS